MSGFGLQTPRGTGTSGYLQKSATEKRLSGFREKRDREALEQQRREKRARMSQARYEASAELRTFDQKREIEVKCMELRESLEEQDLSDSEIDVKVKLLRQSLSKQNKEGVLKQSDDFRKKDDKSSEDQSPGDKSHDEPHDVESEDSKKNEKSQTDETTSIEANTKPQSEYKTSMQEAPLMQTHTRSNEKNSEPKEKSPVFNYVPRYSKR